MIWHDVLTFGERALLVIGFFHVPIQGKASRGSYQAIFKEVLCLRCQVGTCMVPGLSTSLKFASEPPLYRLLVEALTFCCSLGILCSSRPAALSGTLGLLVFPCVHLPSITTLRHLPEAPIPTTGHTPAGNVEYSPMDPGTRSSFPAGHSVPSC